MVFMPVGPRQHGLAELRAEQVHAGVMNRGGGSGVRGGDGKHQPNNRPIDKFLHASEHQDTGHLSTEAILLKKQLGHGGSRRDRPADVPESFQQRTNTATW
jgi:hypothetical protein